jgi:hypothetical protein
MNMRTANSEVIEIVLGNRISISEGNPKTITNNYILLISSTSGCSDRFWKKTSCEQAYETEFETTDVAARCSIC